LKFFLAAFPLRAGSDGVGAPVYLFTPSGTYLGRSENTDASGVAEFLLPDQQFMFRVDYEGSQYWSDVVTIIAYEENDIELNLDLLALDLTNDPNPVKFDGVPPQFEPEKAVVALLGSLPGFMVDSAYAQAGTEKTCFFINDHLGTPKKVIDETGVVVWSADYRPFGEANVTVNTLENNFRFPGQYYDGETGLHYNWHRYYNPKVGRYLRADPIGLNGGISLYSYVRNDPVNSVDPSGQFRIVPTISTVAIVLTTTDFIVTTYHDYQVLKILEEQKNFLERQMKATDPCSEQYRLLKEAHKRVVLQQATIAEKAGMNLIINVIDYLKPRPHRVYR